MKNIIDQNEIDEIENYIRYIRPPEETRRLVDITYRIENLSIIIFEIRPTFQNPDKKTNIDIVKTTFMKKNQHWKVYWKRADLKWHSYQPNPTVKNLLDFIRLIEKDEHHCFWG